MPPATWWLYLPHASLRPEETIALQLQALRESLKRVRDVVKNLRGWTVDFLEMRQNKKLKRIGRRETRERITFVRANRLFDFVRGHLRCDGLVVVI